MLKTIKQRLGRDDEQGFTLIELMVVVLIIAILLAIAIPTFLGARGKANSRAAQSSLRNALTAEQTFYTDNQVFMDTTTVGPPTGAAQLSAVEPNLQWVNAETANPAPNSIFASLTTNASTNDTVFLQSFGKDGNCYTVYQTNGTVAPANVAGTGYAVTKGACVAPAALTAGTPLTINTGNASANVGAAGAPAANAFYTSW
jgi:type IV pilus assembly protein PilA